MGLPVRSQTGEGSLGDWLVQQAYGQAADAVLRARRHALYGEYGRRFGVTWKGRDYNARNWHLSDAINRAVSAANASLYALTCAVCTSMGFIPSLGFVHAAGTLPFIYDIADLYKRETSFLAAFETVSLSSEAVESRVRAALKEKIESTRLMAQMPKDIVNLFQPEET